MNKISSKIYANIPIVFQNAMITVYGYYWKNRRLGKVFNNNLKEFKLRESFTDIQWLEYQTLALRKLLIHAFKTVPFYTEKYKEAGFSLIDFEKFQLADLAKLPYLEKEDLRKFGKTTLLSTNKKKGFFYSSSGSTGTPISVYFSKEMHQIWNAAYETRVRNWAGVNHTMSRGMIGGRRVLPNVIGKAPYYRYNAAEKQTYFSAYHISGETTPNYVEGLKRNKVEYLVGYAMSIYILADFILNLDIESPKLIAVLTSSEKLTSQMRTTIEKAFRCKVFDAYSGVEACGLISENSKNELLFSPDTGIMEIIDITGQQVNPSESGEIIATGLLNHDQPLIRYRIGDRGKVAQDQSTHEFLKMDEIEGRVEDVIINVDGKRMVRFHTLFIEIPNLKAAQIIQKKIDLIQINLIPDTGFDKSNEKLIIKKLQSQLGNVNVEIEYLKSIPKEKNGKFKAVISNL
jgi:phenylacetate-CoA ligase|tara:strand:- start:208 stop:1584 length:1377 start_codon:yes stop_codon:yes gene_type:complete